MKWLLTGVLLLSVFVSSYARERTTPIFVSTQWLADHLNDPDVVVLQVAFNRADYKLGHIPGARFLWFEWLAISTPDASTEMPAIAQADTVLENLGITDKSEIILCFTGQSISITTRMFLAMSYFGLGNQTSFLDGGLDAWKKENREISKEIPVVQKSSLTLHVNPSVVTDADWVKSNLNNPNVVIIDARAKNFYDGAGGGILRQGHIKGAKSLSYTSFFDTTNHVLDKAVIQKLFDSIGVTKETKVISYCHVGQQATVIFTMATSLGYDAALYDGSFEDWNVRGDDYPVEKPTPKKD